MSVQIDADHRTEVEKFKHAFFYTLMDVVIISLIDRFELLKIHVDFWNFLYDLRNAPENENELLKHIKHIYTITLKMDLTLILKVSNYAQKF